MNRLDDRAEIRAARDTDIWAVLADIREADLREGEAWSVRPIDELLSSSMRTSSHTWTATWEGMPIALMGVSPLSMLAGQGAPWMVGTNSLDRHARELLRRSRGVVDEMLSIYPHLVNYVDVRNQKSKVWLRWLGFEFHTPAPFGHMGLPFHRFEMRVH